MTQKTVTEKDMFLQTFQRECETTLKVLRAYPADKGEYRPHEKSRTARELAWTFTIEQGFAGMGLAGAIDFSGPMPQPPATFAECITAFENAGRDLVKKVSQTNDEALERMLQAPVGPGRMGTVRTLDFLWMTLMDQVHHRGQLSVYLRMVGGKVPSIYGPTADEPWM